VAKVEHRILGISAMADSFRCISRSRISMELARMRPKWNPSEGNCIFGDFDFIKVTNTEQNIRYYVQECTEEKVCKSRIFVSEILEDFTNLKTFKHLF